MTSLNLSLCGCITLVNGLIVHTDYRKPRNIRTDTDC